MQCELKLTRLEAAGVEDKLWEQLLGGGGGGGDDDDDV